MELVLKGYDDITTKEMEAFLKERNVTLESTEKKEVYAKYKEVVEKEIKEQEEEKKAQAKKEKEKAQAEANKEIKPSDLIEVMSVTFGGLTYISRKTGMPYKWSQYGDIELLPFEELQTMRSASKDFLTFPYLIINDEAVVRKLNLTKEYGDFISLEQINVLLGCTIVEIEEFLKKSSISTRHRVLEVVSREVGKSLVDFNKIKFFEGYFGVTLEQMPVFNI